MRALVSCLFAAALFADAASAGALAPGRPAGVAAAQKSGPNLYLVATVGTAAVVGVAILIAKGHSSLATTIINGGEQPPVPVVTSTDTTVSTGSTS
jgi:hypothetical protein